MAEDRYDEAFTIEIEAWCHGLANYPGEIYPALVHAVVKELRPSFRAAIENHVFFDVIYVADKICKASKYLVHDKEIVFSILARLPAPADLRSEEELYTLAAILESVEGTYEGAIERMEKRWAALDRDWET